jgi:citrate lyase subunit beta / citryl-CoA lyase
VAGRLRSVLFAPASRPEVLAKLPRSGPDAVVLDLEDAVPATMKPEARAHALDLGPRLAAEHPGLAVTVRVNAVPTDWFVEDLGALTPDLAAVVVPKVESAGQLAAVVEALATRGLGHLGVVAGIETVAGVDRASAILSAPGVTAAYFGAEDYVADLGGVRTGAGTEVLYARSRVAIAARLAGVVALDQVVTALVDEARFVEDAAVGRSLGYRGKLCIHPAQVAWANTAFSPSPQELDRARRLLDAYAAAAARGHASIAFEGQMVDEPLARQARAILAAGDGD